MPNLRLKLTAPTSKGSDLETVRDITPMLAFLTNSTEFRSSLASFVDETTRFFKGDVPPEIAAFLADYGRLTGGSAA